MTDTLPPASDRSGCGDPCPDAVRQCILDAAIGLLAERARGTITPEQICARAGIAPVTFYRYFFSLQQLTEILSHTLMFAEIDRRVQDARAHSECTLERLERFILSAADIAMGGNEVLARNLLGHLLQQASLAVEGTRAHLWDYQRAALGELIREGQECGDVTAAFDRCFLAEIIAGGIETAVINWVFDPDYALPATLRELVEFFRATLSGQQARRPLVSTR